MTDKHHVGVIVAALAAATLVTSELAARSEQARGTQRETRERHVFVSVLGDGEAPVRDLKASEFVVREDGLAREVVRAELAGAPSHIALLIDDSQAAAPLVAEIRAASSSFVRKLLVDQKGPQIALWTFGERPTRVVDFTPSAPTLEKAAGKIFHRTGGGAYLLEAIQEVSRDLRKKEAARPVIVAFVIESGPEFSNLHHQGIADILRNANASLWTVVLQEGPQSLGTPEGRERAFVLGDVGKASGGANKIILTKQALETALGVVASHLTSQYDVVYGRPDSLVPPNKLDVEVKRRDVRVVASQWPRR